MNEAKFINLFVYCDSIAFRRREQSQDVSFTYPFQLRELIEHRLNIKTNLLVRGRGTSDVQVIRRLVEKDCELHGGDARTLNIAVLQFGIVDCAPRPITYPIIVTLRRIPFLGPRIADYLVQHRRRLQRLCSYTLTSRRAFRRGYAAIVKTCYGAKMRPIAVGLPLPVSSIEYRSPGFGRNVVIYNQLIRDVIPEGFCDIEQQITDSLRASFLLPDGHHLTEAGHRHYAEQLFDAICRHLQ